MAFARQNQYTTLYHTNSHENRFFYLKKDVIIDHSGHKIYTQTHHRHHRRSLISIYLQRNKAIATLDLSS